MEINEMINLFKRKWQTVVLFMVLVAGLAFVFSAVQTQKFSSEERFLIVQTYSEEVDPYAASRSTEYLSTLLTEVMYSESFVNQVFGAQYGIDSSYFPTDPKKFKKEWQKTLSTRVLADTGIVEVKVYHEERAQANQLAFAIADVLTSTHERYHSRGDAVSIQIIDQPLTSTRVVQPDILLNTGAGLFLGLILSIAFIYLFPEKEINFIAKKDHVLVEAGEPDFTNPIATPKQNQK